MAVRFDERRKRWVVEFEQTGVRVFQRLPQGCTRAQGEAREAQLRREIYDRETLHKVPDLTIESAINQWLTEDHRRKNKKQAQSEAKQWEPYIKGKRLKDVPEIIQTAIRDWTPQRSSETSGARSRRTSKTYGTPREIGSSSPATVNRRLALMKAVCRHAYKQGRIAENLSGRITMLREDNKRERYLTRAEVKLLAKHSPSRVTQTAITLAAYTGLRASELLGLSAESVHGDTLKVAQSKNGKPRVIPVPPTIKPLLSRLPLECSYWTLHKEFLAACKKAKLRDVKFHDLRHTCASWLINAGVDIYTLSKILGHSSIQTTQRYAHLYHDTLKDAMARLK